MKMNIYSARPVAESTTLRVCAGTAAFLLLAGAASAGTPLEEVDPFIGTSQRGFVHPCALVPFGMVQAGPDTGVNGVMYSAGFRWEDSTIRGFSQTHYNSCGGEFGDVSLMPFTTEAFLPFYDCRYNKSTQHAEPGYYAVKLEDFGVRVEVAAARRAAIYRLTYEKTPARVLLDFANCIGGHQGRQIIESHVDTIGTTMFIGRNRRFNWVDREYSYAVEFSRPWKARHLLERKEPTDRAPTYVLDFDLAPGDTLLVKTAMSSVSPRNARDNLADINAWDFDRTRERAAAAWREVMDRVEVTGGATARRRAFATALFRAFSYPSDIADRDGRYRGADREVVASADGHHYTQTSLWDTFRAAHPLYTLLVPDRVPSIVRTMVAQWRAIGHVPIWGFWGMEDGCMIGTHGVPVIVDAFLKARAGAFARDIDRIDWEEAYRAVRDSLRENHPSRWKESWPVLDRYGYYPFDIIPKESVSRTYECAYDDWCAATMAQALGKHEDAAFFFRRSNAWKKLLDPETRYARGRDSKGNWRTPFDPTEYRYANRSQNDFTEGNALQYTWHVMQDPEGLISALGGRERAARQLDALFAAPTDVASLKLEPNATGLIGQYLHGNEPCHHVIYFYQYLGRPRRTAELVREVFDRFYNDTPDGLCGNDDMGQMSAWYVFSALGFYPFNPCGGDYVLGAPQFPEATLHLPGGKIFRIVARNLSEKNKYVKSATLDGKPLDGFILRHADILRGGELVFEMCN